MIFSTLLSSTFLIFGRAVVSGKEVVALTADNFDQFIKDKPAVLVNFYAPWCGYSKLLKPEYELAAQAIAKDDSLEAVLAKVDCTTEDDLKKVDCTQFGVHGYPTLKFFKGNVNPPIDFHGERTESGFVEWIRIHSAPAVTTLTSAAEIKEFKSKGTKGSVVIIGFFTADSVEAKALNEVVEAHRGNTRETIFAGLVSDPAVKFEGAEKGKLYLYRDFETPVVECTQPLTVEGITTFINVERFPLIGAMEQENYRDYVDRGFPLVWISVDGNNKKETDNVISALMPFAKEHKGELSFFTVDGQKHDGQLYEGFLHNLGMNPTDFTKSPNSLGITNLGISTTTHVTYVFGGKDVTNSAELKTFFGEYAHGTLAPYMKSEPVPESNDGAVYHLVASEFDEVVGQEKNVMVMFYAPWCDRCKHMMPEYEKVGKAFKTMNNVVIAKMDGTQNDIKDEQMKGYPILLFYAKETKTGVKYEGARVHQEIIDWINLATYRIRSPREEL